MSRPIEPLERRFWSKVDKRSQMECWPWLGTKNNHGYGMFQRQDAAGRNGKRLAHRVSYELHYGALPESGPRKERVVLHACDNPACVNPMHLRLGTMKENYDDMASKGRRRIVSTVANLSPVRRGADHPMWGKKRLDTTGAANPSAKLTEAQVLDLWRQRLEGVSFSELSRRFGLDPSTAADIAHGTRWKHLLGVDGAPQP